MIIYKIYFVGVACEAYVFRIWCISRGFKQYSDIMRKFFWCCGTCVLVFRVFSLYYVIC